MGKETALSLRLLRILAAVKELEEAGYRTTETGLSDLLRGSPKTPYALEILASYGYLQSLGGKAVKARIHALMRSGYLTLEYDGALDDRLLVLSPKARSLALPCLEKKPLRQSLSPYRKIERK